MSVNGFNEKYELKDDVDSFSIDKTMNVTSKNLNDAVESNDETLDLDAFYADEDNPYKALEDNLDITNLPDYEDKNNYRFQGFTVTDKYIYVTAYSRKGEPSVILVYDKDGNYLGRVFLPTDAGRNSHLGGISYDKEHNILYVTGKDGEVLVIDNDVLEASFKDQAKAGDEPFSIDLDEKDEFDLNSFIIASANINIKDDYLDYTGHNNNAVIEFINNLFNPLKPTNLSAASVYYDEVNHKLYVPTYSGDTKVFVYDVTFDENGKPTYTFDQIYGFGTDESSGINDVNLPYGVQGVSTYTDSNGDTYLLMVSSYKGDSSVITKYKIKEDGSIEFAGQKVFEGARGLENMVVDPDTGKIYCNMENYVAGSDQDGSEFFSTNVDEINGSSDDPLYVETMEDIREFSQTYDK